MNSDLTTTAPASTQINAAPTGQVVRVIPYRHEEPLFWITAYLSVSLWLVFTLMTLGLFVPIVLIIGFLGLFAHSLLIAWVKGNAVHITPAQLPDVHALYVQCCDRLGIAPEKRPQLYLAQADGMLNAMATRFMRRDFVVLLSSVLDALEDRPDAVKFYMGHELGHVHRKHLSRHWWLWLGMLYPLIAPAYRRAQEYTCDRYGFACSNSMDDARRALAVLAAGSRRWKDMNLEAFKEQSAQTGGFWMAVNELTADYPWLCKRMAILENRDAQFPRRSFWAWLIACFSPPMGYGGAVIGVIYLALIGALFAFLFGWMATSMSGSTSAALKEGFQESLKEAFILPWAKPVQEESTSEGVEVDGDEPLVTVNPSAVHAWSQGQKNSIDAHYRQHKKAPDELSDEIPAAMDGGLGVFYEAPERTSDDLKLYLSMYCEGCTLDEEGKPLGQITWTRTAKGQWTCETEGLPKQAQLPDCTAKR